MTFRRPLLALVLAAGLAAPLAAAAQTPLDPLDARDARRLDRMEQVLRELRSIVFQGRDTGRPVVVQPAETDYRLEELNRRVADLEQVLTRLNSQIETTNFELRQAKEANTALEAQLRDLRDRTGNLEAFTGAPPLGETAGAPPVAGGPGSGVLGTLPAPPQAASGSPREDFDRARGLMLGGDYDSAEAAFERFVADHGGSPQAPEANYWWGKTLVVRGADAEAAGAFIAAIRGWPQTAWAPDGVLELSRSLIALGRQPEACQALAELNRRYPNAAPSIKARASAVRTEARCA